MGHRRRAHGRPAAVAASPRKALERRQRRWAEVEGVAVDARGFVREQRANLHAPLDDAALAELARGSELTPRRFTPARFSWICSSAALVANVFGYWRGRDAAPLLAALGIEARTARIAFEEPLPTGLAGDPPTSDVALHLPDRLVAIESKFCEWLERRPRGKTALKPKYFPPGEGVWRLAGLPRCQALAEDLRDGRERFRHLNAAQILKHALGLTLTAGHGAELMYLFFDWPCREAALHAAEHARLAERIRGDLPFRVLTYQALFAALQADARVPRGYVEYLARRYFS